MSASGSNTIQRKMRLPYISVIIVLVVIATTICILLKTTMNQQLSGDTTNSQLVEAYINGEPLYASEIDNTLKMNPGVSRDAIVENTINDMLLIQYANENNIEVTSDDVTQMVNEYQEMYPESYISAVEGYGEEKFLEGIENRLLVSYALRNILSKPSNTIDTSRETVNRYLIENGIEPENLEETLYDEAVLLYVSNQERQIKDEWIKNVRTSSEIIIAGD